MYSMSFFYEAPRGGCLFEAGRLLTFPTYNVGVYSNWARIRSWAFNRINTVICNPATIHLW